jgi:hypothetical protein
MDEMYNAADPTSIRSAAKAARQADRNQEEIFRGIMSVPPGRAWLLKLLKDCGVFHTTFTGEALSTSFNEGKRSVGVELMSAVLMACPEQFFLAMREQDERTTNPPGRNGYDRGSANGGYTTAESDEYAGGEDPCGND